jgi:hypothetical protein
MPDRTRHRIKITDKNENMRGGPASHIDQGRHSRFTARVLQRPGHMDELLKIPAACAGDKALRNSPP